MCGYISGLIERQFHPEKTAQPRLRGMFEQDSLSLDFQDSPIISGQLGQRVQRHTDEAEMSAPSKAPAGMAMEGDQIHVSVNTGKKKPKARRNDVSGMREGYVQEVLRKDKEPETTRQKQMPQHEKNSQSKMIARTRTKTPVSLSEKLSAGLGDAYKSKPPVPSDNHSEESGNFRVQNQIGILSGKNGLPLEQENSPSPQSPIKTIYKNADHSDSQSGNQSGGEPIKANRIPDSSQEPRNSGRESRRANLLQPIGETVIKINIGRIEVRAMQEPERQRSLPKPAPKPKISLKEYLSGNNDKV
jgi:hypothetical protein